MLRTIGSIFLFLDSRLRGNDKTDAGMTRQMRIDTRVTE